jgi:hypothetical protein
VFCSVAIERQKSAVETGSGDLLDTVDDADDGPLAANQSLNESWLSFSHLMFCSTVSFI